MESFHQFYLLSLCFHHISGIPINHLYTRFISYLQIMVKKNFTFTTHYEFSTHYCIKPLTVKDIEHALGMNIFQDAYWPCWPVFLWQWAVLQLIQLYLPEMMLGFYKESILRWRPYSQRNHRVGERKWNKVLISTVKSYVNYI